MTTTTQDKQGIEEARAAELLGLSVAELRRLSRLATQLGLTVYAGATPGRRATQALPAGQFGSGLALGKHFSKPASVSTPGLGFPSP